MADKKKAREAAAAAAKTLQTGSAADAGSDANKTEGSASGTSSAPTSETSASAGTNASAAPPTGNSTSPTNGNGKSKEKVDLFAASRLATCAGLRKALWSTQGKIMFAAKSMGNDVQIEIVKNSVIQDLTKRIEATGENTAAPWLFVHRVPGDPSQGCVLTDPASLPNKIEPKVVADATSTGTEGSGAPAATGEQGAGEEKKDTADQTVTS